MAKNDKLDDVQELGKNLGSLQKPKFKICVSGAAETGHCAQEALEKSEEVGKEIVLHDCIIVTGAATGIPYWAAKGAKLAGGVSLGLSPAVGEKEHLEVYKLPIDYFDMIVYTGFDYSGRNLFLTRSSDAVIVICGRMGTLNEFTIAFEDNKPIGVLEGSGGMADELRGIIEKAHRGSGKVVFSKDPKELVEKVIEMIKKEKDGLES